MKILITGGAGFIGSHIQDAYIEARHDVVVLDNLSTGKKKFLNPESHFVEVDIREKEKVIQLFEKEKFDVVNHHAAQIDLRASVSDPAFDADVNIKGSLNVLEASVKSGVNRFIFASTGGAMYGEQDYFPADENHPIHPESPYGINKLSIEKYLYYYEKVHGLQYFILRYANIYGQRQNPHGEAGVVAIFCRKLVDNQTPTINGNGKQTRDYVHVSDVVQANLSTLDYQETGMVNIGTGVETTVNDIFNHLSSFSGNNIESAYGPEKKGEQQRSVLSNALAKQVLNWEPTISIEDGLSQTFEYFKKGELR